MSTEPLRCVGALIVDDDGRIFMRRRRESGAWGIVDGHVTGEESAEEALRRVVVEETGWALSVVLATVGQYAYRGDDGPDRVETAFLVRVDGDLDQPRPAEGEHPEVRWLAAAELDLLDEQRASDGGRAHRVVADGCAGLREIGVI